MYICSRNPFFTPDSRNWLVAEVTDDGAWSNRGRLRSLDSAKEFVALHLVVVGDFGLLLRLLPGAHLAGSSRPTTHRSLELPSDSSSCCVLLAAHHLVQQRIAPLRPFWLVSGGHRPLQLLFDAHWPLRMLKLLSVGPTGLLLHQGRGCWFTTLR